MISLRKLFGRRKKASKAYVAKIVDPFQDFIREGGWKSYIDNPPPLDEEIELYRREWGEPWLFLSRTRLHPFTNVNGLYWRPISFRAFSDHDLRCPESDAAQSAPTPGVPRFRADRR